MFLSYAITQGENLDTKNYLGLKCLVILGREDKLSSTIGAFCFSRKIRMGQDHFPNIILLLYSL